ncbi:aminotransferase class IV [Planctomycetota bacterium]|nr:aminotransferase class IV [Planctomycetota bacterium]
MSDYTININGEFVDQADAKISVLDHGFLFGDSIYEVVRTVGGKLFAAKEHLKRLHTSAQSLGLTLQRDDDWICDQWRAMHTKAGHDESYLRMIVTRGEGVLDLHPQSCTTQNYIGIAKPLNKWPDNYYAHGCKIILANVRRNPKQATDPAIKSGNYLNNVMALMEARKQDAAEAVMLNLDGFVTEATTSNVFMVRDGVVHTPALSEGLLEGVTRGFILGVCKRLDIEVSEGTITGDELMSADEVFITSTTRDVMPVSLIGTTKIKRMLGPVTVKISNAYHEVLTDEGNLS